MRLLGFILSLSIVLVLFTVSYESEYWSLWGGERKASHPGPNVAEAAPVVGNQADEGSGFASEDISEDVIRDAEAKQGLVEDEQEEQETRTEVVREEYSSSDTSTATTKEESKEEPRQEQEEESKEEPRQEQEEESKEEPRQEQEEESKEEPKQEPKEEPMEETKEKLEEKNPTESKPLSQDSEEKSTTHSFDATDKPEYHTKNVRRPRAKTFLMVFMGHSGSTAFITELRTHSEFLVEKLEPLDHHEYHRDTDLAYEYAKELMDRGIAKGKIPGFKIRPYHILNKPELWRQFVKEYDCRVIWQYRENIVKQAIGEYRNRYLNDTSVIEGLKPGEKPCDPASDQKCTFRIEDMKFLHSLMNTMSSSDELLASAVRALERNEEMSIVKYEDYLYKRERTMKETFDFLGVDWQETAPQRQKASPDNLCKMVTNFQDVCDRFLPCQLWRPYLYDDINDCRCKPGDWKNFDPAFCKRSAWYQQSKS